MNTEIFEKLFHTYPSLEVCRQDILKAAQAVIGCYEKGGKVLVCGNGGSASDAEHIVGELMKGFIKKRPIPTVQQEILTSRFGESGAYVAARLQSALPAISLVSQTALQSAIVNDTAGDMVYAQQVYGYGKPGDILIAVSTSGNAANAANAVIAANLLGMTSIALTGGAGGKLKHLCEVAIVAPAAETYAIQEFHLPIYHCLCAAAEEHFFKV